MLINRGNLDSLFTGFKALLAAGIAMAMYPVEKIATVVTSTTAIEKYPMLDLLSTMRKWVGDRQVNNLKGEVLQVVNEDYEHTIGINRNHIEDDTMGLTNPKFKKMGQDAGNFWGKLAIEALLANLKWLDGKLFFVTTRKFGDFAINNKGTGILNAANFKIAYTAMGSYCGHNGESLDVIPDLLVCGASNADVAFSILKDRYVAKDGVQADNPHHGKCEILVHPKLVGTHASKWFLMQSNGVVKPIIVQKRKVGELIAWDTDKDECVKKRNECEYGLHYRGAGALTLPPLAYYSDGSVG